MTFKSLIGSKNPYRCNNPLSPNQHPQPLSLFKPTKTLVFMPLKHPKKKTYYSLQASLNIFSLKFIVAITVGTFFSNSINKVNIVHCYEFVFGLVEIK
jgi:hypothetical protein